MFTLEELELMYKLVDEWIDKSADPSRADELREKIEGMICLRTLEGGEDYKFSRVGDVKCQSCGEWYPPNAPDDWGTHLVELCNLCYAGRLR